MEKNKKTFKEKYAIIGQGGIKIVFSVSLYNKNDEEAVAINRTIKLGGCRLFHRDTTGEISQVYPVVKKMEKKETKEPVASDVYPEMLGNDPALPGIRVRTQF